MEMPPDKFVSRINRPVLLSADMITMLDMVLWLIGFFRLSEEEQSAAGICVKANA